MPDQHDCPLVRLDQRPRAGLVLAPTLHRRRYSHRSPIPGGNLQHGLAIHTLQAANRLENKL